jgi:hypothetical protein
MPGGGDSGLSEFDKLPYLRLRSLRALSKRGCDFALRRIVRRGRQMARTPTEISQRNRTPKYTAVSAQGLADHLRVLKLMGYINGYPEFAHDAGVKFDKVDGEKGYGEKISRWVNHCEEYWDVLEDDNFNNLLDHTIKLFPWLHNYIELPVMRRLRSPIYYSAAHILQKGATIDVERITRQFDGIYEAFRPSAKNQGYIFIGALELRYDDVSDSFITREIYGNNAGEQWEFIGAFIPIMKSKMMIISINENDGVIDTKYINSINYARSNVISFSGWVADMSGLRYYSAPIFFRKRPDYERISDVVLEFRRLDAPVDERITQSTKLLLERELANEDSPAVWAEPAGKTKGKR